jgi:hypothetical protein
MPRIRLLPLLAAILLLLTGASTAHAGQYTLSYDFSSDLSGWSGYVEPGFMLCGPTSTGGCADLSTNRIMARPGAAQAIWSQARWEWTAPPGTTIVGGSFAYRTRMRHSQFYARIKMRQDGVSWDAAPTILSEQQTTTLTDHVVALPGGFRQLGVSLYAHPAAAGVVTDTWDDYVTFVRFNVTVDDSILPGLGWIDGGGLTDGAWHRGDVCATLTVADSQSGLGAAWIVSGAVSSSWIAPRTGSQYQPGIAGAQPSLCLSAAALGDGVHVGTAGADDATGLRAPDVPFRVHIDATPPTARLLGPAAAAADSRPLVELDVADATSGIASVVVQIDGTTVPLDLVGGRASGRPVAGLAYGAHTLAWSIADVAGNRTDGSSQFSVPDTTPPVFGAPQPAAGTSLGDGEVLSVVVPVSDAGSGFDPASISLTLDGTPLTTVWQVDGIVHGVAGVRLAAGVHHLALQVADRAANPARLAWDISVAAGATTAAGSAAAAGAPAAGAAPAAPGATGAVARTRAALVRAVKARVGASRPRVVTVHLRARPRLRIRLEVRCGTVVRMLHTRANARGIATVRVACAGAATVRMVVRPGRLLVHIAARRLPLRLEVRPLSRSAPTVAQVRGRLAELRDQTVVLEALTATGWRRVGQARADSAGRFATSFTITHAGQFALRARVPARAAVASAPFVLTMR